LSTYLEVRKEVVEVGGGREGRELESQCPEVAVDIHAPHQ
jgi:hypothetical protein